MASKNKFVIFLVFSIVISQGSCLPSEVSYIGCYDNPVTNTSSLSVTSSEPNPTWAMCVTLCAVRLSRYAGIDTRNSSCLCGNDITELSTSKDSVCDPCEEDVTRFCGSSGTMSVYQLSLEAQTPTVLLATDKGVERYVDISTVIRSYKNYKPEILQPTDENTIAVAYHFVRQEIYYLSANKIFKISLLNEYNIFQLVTDTKCLAVDLTLDWVHNNIYWACTTDEIFIANLDNFNAQYFRRINDIPQHLAVEPYMNRVFAIARNKLWEPLEQYLKPQDLLNSYKFREILHIAIDVQQESMYIIGDYDMYGNERWLVSTNYRWTGFKMVYRGPEFGNLCGLDVFNGTIIWCNNNNRNYTLYSGVISSKYELEDIKVIYYRNSVINDIQIYGPHVQSPSVRYLCQKRNCSHSCSVVSPNTTRCSCPETMYLSSDKTTCAIPAETTTDHGRAVTPGVIIDSSTEGGRISSLFSSELTQHDYDILLLLSVAAVLSVLVIVLVFQVYFCMRVKRSHADSISYRSGGSIDVEPVYSIPHKNT